MSSAAKRLGKALLTLAGVAALGVVALAMLGFHVRAKRERAAAPRAAVAQSPQPLENPAPTPPMSFAEPRRPESITGITGERAEALIAGLDRLDSEGRHADIAVGLFNSIPSMSPADAELVATWLDARTREGNLPALHLQALARDRAGKHADAARTFIAASIIARIDAARCADPTAASAVGAIEQRFSDIRTALRADPALAKDAARSALDLEERLKDRKPALWIANHGMDSLPGGKGIRFLSDEQWGAARAKYRDSMSRSSASSVP